MRQMTESLVDRGGREDSPTGSTPRKRVWQYTDDWELTKDRETIIQGWKRRGVQSQECGSNSESSSTRRFDIPQECPPASLKQSPFSSVADQHEDIPEPPDPLPPPYLEADPEQRPRSNLSLSLAPSIIPPIALPSAVSSQAIKAKIGKAGSDVIPAMGTLTERSTNLMYGRGTRRAR